MPDDDDDDDDDDVDDDVVDDDDSLSKICVNNYAVLAVTAIACYSLTPCVRC